MNTRAPQPGATDQHAHLAECLERGRAGDQHALDEIVEALTPLLWHVARGQGLSTEDAADAVQTTWLELVRRMHDIRSPQALTAWLVTATRREAWHVRTRRRRQASAPAELLDAIADPGLDIEEIVGRSERYRSLWRNFQELPARCRELLRIVAMIDRPDYSAVSQALRMPSGSIGPTRGRCLAKLRALLLADPAWSPR